MKKVFASILILILVLSVTSALSEPTKEPKTYKTWTYIGVGSLLPDLLDVVEPDEETEILNIVSDNVHFWVSMSNVKEEDFISYLAALEEGGYAMPLEQIGSFTYYIMPNGMEIFIDYRPEDGSFYMDAD